MSENIDALNRERLGYLRRGLTDRAKAVEHAIKDAGGKVEKTPELETANAKPTKRSR